MRIPLFRCAAEKRYPTSYKYWQTAAEVWTATNDRSPSQTGAGYPLRV